MERLGVIHSIKNENRVIEIDNIDQTYSLTRLLLPEPVAKITKTLSAQTVEMSIKTKDVVEFISKISGVEIKSKFASSIAVRVGRPEKAART